MTTIDDLKKEIEKLLEESKGWHRHPDDGWHSHNTEILNKEAILKLIDKHLKGNAVVNQETLDDMQKALINKPIIFKPPKGMMFVSEKYLLTNEEFNEITKYWTDGQVSEKTLALKRKLKALTRNGKG